MDLDSSTLQSCLSTVALALAMVMAGTGLGPALRLKFRLSGVAFGVELLWGCFGVWVSGFELWGVGCRV